MEAWRKGDTSRATRLQRESLAMQRDFTDYYTTGLCVEALAWIATSERRSEQAARFFGLADTIRREAGLPLLIYFNEYHDRCQRQIRRSLGEPRYGKFFEQGANVPLQEAIGYALGERRRTNSQATKEPTASLSPREREIADLVAQGMSNKQIANDLVISPRTAEAHVENILVKLGFTARAQIAAWVSAQREGNAQ